MPKFGVNFPPLPASLRLDRLELPTGPVRMVLDTDTYNEIDDQFALVQALLSPEHLSLEAVYAAPFQNLRAGSPAEGMEKSYREILKIYKLLGRDPAREVYRGAPAFLDSSLKPVESPAVEDLIRRARDQREVPLYIAAIGAATNIASAILLAPEIVRQIVVVWLGGHAYHWPENREFNLLQDPNAARLLFDCGVPLVHLPCQGVVSHLLTGRLELQNALPQNFPAANYLGEIFNHYMDHLKLGSKVLWGMAAVGYLIDPAWVPSRVTPCPAIGADLGWSFDESRPPIRSAFFVKRDQIFRDFFTKLRQAARA